MDGARWINVAIGAWLFASAWLLRAPEGQAVGQALLGGAIFVVAFLAMAYPRLRWINTALALWAAISPFALGLAVSAAAVNRLAAGLLALVVSLWPAHGGVARGHGLAR